MLFICQKQVKIGSRLLAFEAVSNLFVEFVDIVVQLIGRGFVETSIITLVLYTMELYPTVLRWVICAMNETFIFFHNIYKRFIN